MPVSVDGIEAGTIGLLGPTRMNYPLALAAARVVGDRLGERLSEAGPDRRTGPVPMTTPTSTSCSASAATPPTTS